MSASETTLPSEESLRLREYLGVIRRRKWSIAVITLLALMGALLYAKRATPIYESSASVLATQTLLTNGAAQSDQLSLPTEQKLVTSDPVNKCASLLL